MPITKIKFVKQNIPVELTACAPRPPLPEPPVTDAKVANLIVDLIEAHDDCYSKNRRIGELQEDTHEKAD
jgi:hypothetical protein